MSSDTYSLDNGLSECTSRIKALSQADTGLLVGIAGGSCAGKSFVTEKLAQALNATCFPMDDYYVGKERMKDDNFDDPDAIEFPLLKEHLQQLCAGQTIIKPVYNFAQSRRIGEGEFSAGKIILVEGLFALHETLRPGYSLKVFVEASEEVRYTRRLERDTTVRNIPRQQVLHQWKHCVLPSHGQWVQPQKHHADLVILND